MNKLKLMLAIVTTAMAFTACDDTTDTLGYSVTSGVDKFDILTDTFNVATQSVIVDSVLSNSMYTYIGHIKDNQTNTYVTSNFTTQFGIVEKFDEERDATMPKADSIRSFDENGKMVATSCQMRLYFDSFVGDSLNTMKIAVQELAKPIEESKNYYTNFDPEKEGYLRTDANAIKTTKVYSYKGVFDEDNMYAIVIPFDQKYVTPDGREYNNYGTYLMRTYYEHPEYFKNSYTFTHNVCPGFHVKNIGGIGNIGRVKMSRLDFGFKALYNDSVVDASSVYVGNEEVMQTTEIKNDKEALKRLVADNSCTYLKTPSGIFTEVTLPIEDIKKGHENDTISSAKIVFTRMNEKGADENFSAPTNVLLLPKDSVFKFFEDRDLQDNKSSYLATLSTSYNTYTFSNISELVNTMWNNRKTGKANNENWNKVVLVPVDIVKYTTSSSSSYYYSSSSSTQTNINNEINLKSVRLKKGYGTDNQRDGNGWLLNPGNVTISVIYNRFNK